MEKRQILVLPVAAKSLFWDTFSNRKYQPLNCNAGYLAASGRGIKSHKKNAIDNNSD
jgi:hypothetical protein